MEFGFLLLAYALLMAWHCILGYLHFLKMMRGEEEKWKGRRWTQKIETGEGEEKQSENKQTVQRKTHRGEWQGEKKTRRRSMNKLALFTHSLQPCSFMHIIQRRCKWESKCTMQSEWTLKTFNLTPRVTLALVIFWGIHSYWMVILCCASCTSLLNQSISRRKKRVHTNLSSAVCCTRG